MSDNKNPNSNSESDIGFNSTANNSQKSFKVKKLETEKVKVR